VLIFQHTEFRDGSEASMLRSVLAVVTGYLVFALPVFALFQVTGQPPHGEASIRFIIGATVYGVATALVGGYLSGWIAGRRPLAHGAATAIVLALGAAGSLAATIGKGFIWSQVAALTLMAPAALIGGWLRQCQASAAPVAASASPVRDRGPLEEPVTARP
jgi:hypothetical protein